MIISRLKGHLKKIFTCGQQIEDKLRISNVCAAFWAVTNPFTFIRVGTTNPVGVKHASSHPGEDQEPKGQKFEPASKDTSGFSVGHVLAGKSTLDYNLEGEKTVTTIQRTRQHDQLTMSKMSLVTLVKPDPKDTPL